MAETLGQAVLEVGIDDSRLRAGLQGVERQAGAAGEAISAGIGAVGNSATAAGEKVQGFNRKIGGLGGNNTIEALNRQLARTRERLEGAEIGSRVFRKLQRDVEGLEKELARAERRTNTLQNAFGTVRNVLATVGAVAVFRDVIKSATELENITRKLTNTLGDQGAQQAIGFLRGLSDSLGLSFNVLADSFGSFTAAASAANIPLNEQKDLFAAVSTSAQRLGLSNDAINGSLLALQQVAAKGTVQMEELRGQLGERLPTAFAATSRGLGISNAELIKLVESGKLTADQFFPALTKGLNELNGSGTGSVPTAAQNFASFGNELEKLKAQVGTEFLPSVVEGVQKLSQALGGLNVQIQANKLGLGGGAIQNLVGFTPNQGAQAVGTLQQLANTYGLSQKQARALFTDAVKDVGATADAFGRLNLSAEQYEKILEQLPGRADKFTKSGRDATAIQEAEIADARAAQLAADKRLDTPDKIEARLKTAKKELGSLDPNSADAQAKLEEIGKLDAQSQSVKERAKEIQKAIEDAAKKSKEVADNFVTASNAAKAADESFADVVAGSPFASESAQKEQRRIDEGRILTALKSKAVDQEAVNRSFDLGVPQAGSLSIEAGGKSINQTFTGQIGAADLSGQSNQKLNEIANAISPLANAQATLTEAQKELTAATKGLTEAQIKVLERESNLEITVPVGKTETVYLP